MFYHPLHLQKHLLPIHHPQCLIDDDCTPNGYEGGVKVTDVGFQAIQQGARYKHDTDGGKYSIHKEVHECL